MKDITLRRFDGRGDASTVVAAVQGIRVTAAVPVVAGGELESFVIVGSRGANDSEAAKATVEAFRLDVRGQITQLSVASGLGDLVHLEHVGGDEFVLVQHHRGVEHGRDGDGIHTDILRLRATGETQLLVTMAGLCYRLAASAQRIACAVSPVLRSDQTNDVVVVYSATGQALWRHALARGDTVDRMGLLESGDLIYSIGQRGGATVTRLGASGTPLWSETLRSTGEYTFLTRIEPLRNGRLAFLGSTGPWNGFTSTDTSAMLLVTRTSAGGLGTPSIVSTIMTHTAAR
ncbi:MAG TPA: hypothetical protein VFJ95_06265 [Gammaproteobacteria bacterium]|nr:hypothetical protein [Gammaproteobacteria bacterium]